MFLKDTNLRIIIENTRLFLGNNYRYFFVFSFFLFVIFYHYFVIPLGTDKKDNESKNKTQAERLNLNSKNQEVVFPRIFQSQAGDIFRIGSFTKTEHAEVIEIFAQSKLHETIKIGEWQLKASDTGEYNELFFEAPGRYEDIKVGLKKNEGKDLVSRPSWDDSAIYINSFSVSRITINNSKQLQELTPTIFGISSMNRDVLISESDLREVTNYENKPTEWVFQSKGDFLRALEFSGKIVGSGRQEYVFKLQRYSPDQTEEGETLFSSSFVLDSLNDLLDTSGNYHMPFAFPLKQGEWYKISFTKTPSKDKDNFFTVGSLRSDIDTFDENPQSRELALLIGERLRTKNTQFLDGAKLEDLGKHLAYSFSLQGLPADFTNIFDASSGIVFDIKKQLVTGNQKRGQFFIYKFEMPSPFDRFVLEATQEGNDEKEIKLEYSFDAAFWKEIPFVQAVDDAQRFLLILNGDDKSRTVYVRTSYNGAEKKSGFFALETLNVNASLEKMR